MISSHRSTSQCFCSGLSQLLHKTLYCLVKSGLLPKKKIIRTSVDREFHCHFEVVVKIKLFKALFLVERVKKSIFGSLHVVD